MGFLPKSTSVSTHSFVCSRMLIASRVVGGTLSPGRGHRFAISRSGALSGGWPSASGPSPEVDGQLADVLAIIAAGGRAGRAQSTRQLALPQVAAQQLQPAVRSQVLTHELDVQVSLEHASQPRCAQTHQNGLLCVGSDVGTSIPTKTFPLGTHRRPFCFTRILALSRPSCFRIGARSTDPLRAALRSVHPRTPGRYSGI